MNPALDALMGAAAAVAAVPLDADRHRHAHVRAAATQLSGACADMKVKGQVGGGDRDSEGREGGGGGWQEWELGRDRGQRV